MNNDEIEMDTIEFKDCLRFTNKKKEELRCMLFQITQICFNESDYPSLHSLMRLMTENGAKTTINLPQ